MLKQNDWQYQQMRSTCESHLRCMANRIAKGISKAEGFALRPPTIEQARELFAEDERREKMMYDFFPDLAEKLEILKEADKAL